MGLDRLAYQMGGNLLSCKSFQMSNHKLRSSANIRVIWFVFNITAGKKRKSKFWAIVCASPKNLPLPSLSAAESSTTYQNSDAFCPGTLL